MMCTQLVHQSYDAQTPNTGNDVPCRIFSRYALYFGSQWLLYTPVYSETFENMAFREHEYGCMMHLYLVQYTLHTIAYRRF